MDKRILVSAFQYNFKRIFFDTVCQSVRHCCHPVRIYIVQYYAKITLNRRNRHLYITIIIYFNIRTVSHDRGAYYYYCILSNVFKLWIFFFRPSVPQECTSLTIRKTPSGRELGLRQYGARNVSCRRTSRSIRTKSTLWSCPSTWQVVAMVTKCSRTSPLAPAI